MGQLYFEISYLGIKHSLGKIAEQFPVKTDRLLDQGIITGSTRTLKKLQKALLAAHLPSGDLQKINKSKRKPKKGGKKPCPP